MKRMDNSGAIHLNNNLKTKDMKTYNEIKTEIRKLPSTVKPISNISHDLKHSDGLTQTHREDVYDEPIPAISKAIWSNGSLSLKEKQELNEYLVSKLSK